MNTSHDVVLLELNDENSCNTSSIVEDDTKARECFVNLIPYTITLISFFAFENTFDNFDLDEM